VLIQTQLRPVDHEHACAMLEAFAEGLVLAMMVEIGADPDNFPCCIKCGGFRIDARRAIVDGASELAERKSGCELSLVAYQCAQRRIEKDPNAAVMVEHVYGKDGEPIEGRYRFLLKLGRKNAAGQWESEDPLAELRELEPGCNCPDAKGAA
jgi:hypothetical protein